LRQRQQPDAARTATSVGVKLSVAALARYCIGGQRRIAARHN